VVELKLEDIHVVREFPDVFPDDLPGMPHERVIEFKIELQHETLLQPDEAEEGDAPAAVHV
jgi:hypothetical protein